MDCPNCKKQIDDRVANCPECDVAIPTSSVRFPTVAQPKEREFSTYLVWAMLVTSFLFLPPFGVFAVPFGVVAIVFAVMAQIKYDEGDEKAARKLAKDARAWSCVGLFVGLLIAVVVAGIVRH